MGAALDPFGYRFELVCTDHEGFVDVACRVKNDICHDGEDGQLVQWYRGLLDLGSAAWTEAVGGLTCIYAAKPENILEKIAARIESDFRSLPVDAGSTTIQPAPHTLVGAHTNVYADAAEQRFAVRILGQDVAVVATPIDYTWNYGDGSSLGPVVAPGGPLPQDRWGEQTATSHVYKDTGDFRVTLTTTFKGTYSVNGGPAVPIPGTGSFTAPPAAISVWRSKVNNYADNCLENPNGTAC
ncbi:PKD domain-containing protein [Arthrobacter sp. GCM10027362]